VFLFKLLCLAPSASSIATENDYKSLLTIILIYLGQASITSHDVPIEKIVTNTEFKLSFTSPSTIEELASSFRTDLRQVLRCCNGLLEDSSSTLSYTLRICLNLHMK